MAESRPARKDAQHTVQALLGRAAPPPGRRSAGPEPEPELAVDQPPPAEPTPRAPRPRKRAAAPPPTAAGDQIVQARIPASLFALVRQAKNASGDTHETWFLDALDAVIDDLAEVYRPAARRSSRVPVRRRRTRRPSSDPLVAYPLRLSAEERALLDELIAELGPPSLADLVTTVVRLRLRELGLLDPDA